MFNFAKWLSHPGSISRTAEEFLPSFLFGRGDLASGLAHPVHPKEQLL